MDSGKPDTGSSRTPDWASEERISWFPVPDEEDLDPRVAELVAKQREKLGASTTSCVPTPGGRS